MKNLPFNVSGLTNEQVNLFTNVHSALKDRFGIQPTGHIDFQLQQFEVFKSYTSAIIRNSYVIKQENNDCYVLFLDTHQKVKDPKGNIIDHYEHQIWALAYLKQDMGRVLIRPETFTDKLLELLHPLELDFAEDKAFSDAFYVVVNDHAKAIAGMDREFRNAVMDIRHDGLLIEVVEHNIIIGDRRPMQIDKAVHMASFVARLCECE